MAEFRFKTIFFSEDKSGVKATFMKYFYFCLDRKELLDIGKYSVEKGVLNIQGNEGSVQRKFNFLLEKGFSRMRTALSDKPAIYIHQFSGIPLMGSNEFGIVDRGTNFIEIKPITTCNIDCIYCSVDHTRRLRDMVVEEPYLTEWVKKVIAVKKNTVNVHIGGQGEPLMYSELPELAMDLRKLPKIGTISVNTNGILLNKSLADRLVSAGITHFHISLNAFSTEKAGLIANKSYPLENVKRMCEYLSKKARVILVPVWIPSVNDEDMVQIIEFARKINANIGIQNFLFHSMGKKPVNSLPMKVFFHRLAELEEKHGVDLHSLGGELKILPDNELEKPFRTGQIITAEVKSDGRLPGTKIAVAGERAITVIDCQKKGTIKVRIIRDKDNIFTGTAAL